MFAEALDRKATVGWGDSCVDFENSGNPDLILANGAIPVTNLKQDTEPIQVLQGLGGGGRVHERERDRRQPGMPKIIGRGLAAADFDNDGRMGVAINTIGGPLVLLEDTGPVGHWLEVSLRASSRARCSPPRCRTAARSCRSCTPAAATSRRRIRAPTSASAPRSA